MKSVPIQICIIAIFIGSVLSCRTAEKASLTAEPNIMWQVSPIKMDGNSDDWILPYQFTDDKSKIQFSFSNDRNNFYITVKTNDRFVQMRMLNAGMDVWIDKEGKKNKNTVIFFPIENTNAFNSNGEANKKKSLTSNDSVAQRLDHLVVAAQEPLLQSSNDCKGGYLISQNNSCNIEVKVGTNVNNELVWEAIVPFKSFYKSSLDNNDLGNPLSVCFQIHALEQPKMCLSSSEDGSNERLPGGLRGEIALRGESKPMHDRPRIDGDMEDRLNSFESTSTWARIHLAYNAE